MTTRSSLARKPWLFRPTSRSASLDGSAASGSRLVRRSLRWQHCERCFPTADTNQTLTSRMLTLAEGQTLTSTAHATVIRGLARTYGGTHTSGHRLLSLATEVARYWRTLPIDYKFKVDE